MRKLLKAMRFIYLSLIVALLFFCLMFGLMQTKWAKEKIAQSLIKACAANGIQIKMGRIEGSLPFTWHIDRLSFKWGTENALHLDKIKVRFAIFPLIKKTLVASYFNVEKAHFVFASSTYSQPLSLDTIKTEAKELAKTLFISNRLVIHRLKIHSLTCENLHSKQTGLYFIIADIDLGKNLRHFHCNTMISPRGHPENALQCTIIGNQKLNHASVNMKAHLSSLEPFQPFYAVTTDEQIRCTFSIAGEWTSWSAFFHDAHLSSPLSGFFKGELHPLSSFSMLYRNNLKNRNFDKEQMTIVLHQGMSEGQNFEIEPTLSKADSSSYFGINRPWEIDTRFAIDTPHSLLISSCLVHSDVCDVNFSGEIEQDLVQSKGLLSVIIPDLSAWDAMNLKGSATVQASYAQGQWTSDILAERAECKGLLLEQVSAHIGAKFTDQGWKGQTQVTTQGGPLPMKSAFDFLFQKERLSLYGFSLEGPGIILAGDLSIMLYRFLLTGALFGHVDHLHSLAFLLGKNTMDAHVGLECQFSHEEEKQNVRCSLLGKNTLYGNKTIDQFSLQFNINDLFCQPLGSLHFSAEGLHSPLYDIRTVDFSTASEEEEEWPFTIHLEGDLEDPFSLYAQGKWKKEDTLFSVETIALSGKLLSYPIVLQSPCLFEKGAHFVSLSPLEMSIGDGHLFGSLDLNPVRSTAQLDLEHFPLTLLSLLYPNHALAGALSLKGFLDASEENIQGSLNASLEEIHFLHFDKKEPFQAKGSLQAHLERGIVQTHAHLAAIKEQYIDFSATLPILHTVYPLHLAFNMQQPVSSELVVEGRLQDLFDFINLGIHQATGYVSSRLFLSHTLHDPAVQGNIEWREGTYENFLTGTALKDIHAEMQAANHALQLLSFTAKDDKGGSVQGAGKMDLDPQAHFPYQFIAELDNFRTVHFNPLDCNLTGALYISGNLRQALAQGNLIIPHAEFHIPDKLPFEVPVLPVTFTNRSPALASTAIVPSPAFPFHIHLELTAEDHVQVTGKGLNSEWKGSLLINGTNMNVLANGSLQLIKGEYDFFGKKFKLTDGQIIFNDKPSPSATINLSGNLSLSDTIITAHLRGPLSSPTLTFQSNPQMSTSAILARILFNKDISDISQPEAIQLATTLISLSGGAGPSMLETIRKNIGVDRLAIASQTAHPDEIAVQIGKYLTKGVLVTLSQSATSSQVIVEVEFNYGFVFQAETQEEQEGKFSLKWTHSY